MATMIGGPVMECDIKAETKEEITAMPFSDNTGRTAKIAVFPAWAYGIISAIFSFIALGGLFGGYLTEFTAIGRVIADRNAIYSDSLFGLMVEILRGSIAAPAIGEGGFNSLPFALYCWIFFLIAAIALSLTFTILALVIPRKSKKFCLLNGQTVLIAYGALFTLSALYLADREGVYAATSFDLPSAVVCVACALLLFFLACTQNKGRAFSNLLLYLLSLLSIFSLIYPATALSSDLNDLLTGKSALETGIAVSLGFMFSLTVLNLVLSVFRLNAGKTYVFDLARFGLQTAAVISLISTSLMDSYAIFTDQLLPIIILIASTLAAFFLAAFNVSLISKKAKR